MNYKIFFLYVVFSISSVNLKAQNNTLCENLQALCFENNTFVSTNNINSSSIGQIACLGSTPDPLWNYIQVDNSGTLNIEVKQINNSGNLIDVDFVIWGPYSSFQTLCDNSSSYPNEADIIDCSFSPFSIENFTIPNAQSDDFYILLTTNYSGQEGEIIITQSNSSTVNAGSIYSNVEIDLGPDQTLCNDEISTTLNAYFPGVQNYEWFKDGVFLSDQSSSELIVSESGNYVVTAYNSCNTVGQDNINIAFVDCSNYGLINVNSFSDLNNNSVFDSDESLFNNGYFTYEQNSDGIINYITSSTGDFSIISNDGNNTYDISYFLNDDYQNCYSLPLTQFNSVNVENGNEINLDFSVIEQQVCEDIAVSLNSSQPPVPGFNIFNSLTIENLGIVPVSGTIEFNLDDNLTFNSATYINQNYTLTPNPNGFVLDFVDLQPNNTSNIDISIYCPNNLVLGNLITNTAEYITGSNDLIVDNNFYAITESIVGSFDPNDIMESNGPEIIYEDFITTNEFLYYTIRYQNLGTAEAVNVKIENSLDSFLDKETLQMVDSSHDLILRRVDNQLTFDFKDIYLPAESQNEEGSKGFVTYKIKPVSGYDINTIIQNTAEIYFDFNAAVVTNTFTTSFVTTPLSVEDFEIKGFNLHPNPANGEVSIRLNESLIGDFDLTVLNIQGKVMLSESVNSGISNTINVYGFESGMYFVKINNSITTHTQKLIVR